MSKFYSLFGFLALVFAISAVSSYLTMPAVQGWYQEISRPAWTPPDWVFAPVWTTLYILIAVSGWLVWRKLPALSFGQKLKSPILLAYWVQLALNFSWSLVFFGIASFVGGGVIIALLLVAIALNIKSFKKISQTAAYLLWPYLAWVAYASSLNFAIIAMN